MPVKRRLAKRRDHLVTPAAVVAYLAGDHNELHRALDLRPWNASPLDVPARGEPPAWMTSDESRLDWHQARDLRRDLEAAASKQQ